MLGLRALAETMDKETDMKKIVKILISAFVLTALPLGVNMVSPARAGAEAYTVYVSSSGNDANDGTSGMPYQTLDKALSMAQDGGTVVVKDTITLDAWNPHGKYVTNCKKCSWVYQCRQGYAPTAHRI